MKATDDVNIRQVAEQRHLADVSALSSQYNAAAQAQNTAMGNAIASAGTAVNAYSNRNATPDTTTGVAPEKKIKKTDKAKEGDRIDTRFNY